MTTQPVYTNRVQTPRGWKQLVVDVQEIFRAWPTHDGSGIDKREWGVTELQPGNGAEIWYYLPYDPDRKSISFISQNYANYNLLCCVQVLAELQRAQMRGGMILSGASALLALPPGPEGNNLRDGFASAGGSGRHHVPGGRDNRKSRFRGLAEAFKVLGIGDDAAEEDLEDMYRVRARRYKGGDPAQGATEQDVESFKALNDARDFVRRRKGWAA